MPEPTIPPSARAQLPRAQLPHEFQTLLSRLEQKYRSRLRVTTSDREWLEFHVEGVPIAQLHSELNLQKHTLLAGFVERMQLIHPLRPGASGLYFHLLSVPSFLDRASLAAFGG